jgi:hypothetical protein
MNSLQKKRTIRVAQERLKNLGHYTGDLDGLYGRLMEVALDRYYGNLPAPNQNPVSSSKGLPADNTSAITDYYGKPSKNPTYLEWFNFAYPMKLAWVPTLGPTLHRHRCHKLCVNDLEAIFQAIWQHYGKDYDKIKAHGLHLYGGCHNYRKMRGGTSWSRHSWGIAIDIDPDHNRLKWGRDRARMPEAVIDIFEAHGWLSGGRSWGYDFMHFQRTK